MTDDQLQSIKDDIAYMKALAQEGRQAPLLGGTILICAGLVFGLASVVHWAILTGVLAVPKWWLSGVWLTAMVVFFVVLTVVSMRIGRRPGVRSVGNRASHAVWQAVGYSIFSLGLAMIAIQLSHPAFNSSLVFPSLILGLYGTGWAVSGTMAGQKWMGWVAMISWIAAPAVALLAGSPHQYLAYAAALLACTLFPGLKMVREEPSDVV